MLYGFCVFKETNKASYTNLKKKKSNVLLYDSVFIFEIT